MAVGEKRETTLAGDVIHPETAPGAVRLIVGDLDVMRTFYDRALGLSILDASADVVRLGAGSGAAIELVHRPEAPLRPPRTTGLFHLAILVPSRIELARAIRRVVDAEWSFTGAADHLVSEAMYLNDPEGNGIEIYRDRPRTEWRRSPDGELAMATLPLDVDAVIGELGGSPDPAPSAHADTRIGHVHLQVADIPASEDFYRAVLGFEVTVRSYPGALFVAAGGYHHHLGLNTWAGVGAPPPPRGARGLDRFEIVLPNDAELARVESRLTASGIDFR
ncbi:MAG: VOC family protein, partial [Actinomycetota bacterium]